jgi:hypothetical protein
VRRPGHPVRHHHQRLAHLQEHRADQRVEPVLRVHVPRRLGVQPGVAEPDEVPCAPARDLRRRALQARGGDRDPRPGDHRRQLELPDRGHRAEQPRLPPPRPRLREPRRAPDVAWACPTTPTRAAAYAGAITSPWAATPTPPRPDRPEPRDLRGLREEREPFLGVIEHAPRSRLRDRRALRGAARSDAAGPPEAGTRRSSWARSTASATRRSRCSPPPGPSPS